MAFNQRIAFRIFISILIVVFAFIAYIVLFDENSDDAPLVERFFEAIEFKSAEDADTPAVPLPSDSGFSGSSGSGSGGGESGGGAGGSSGSGAVLRFCTFDAFHVITSEVPCRCGFNAVCYSLGSVCDATFNNGQGLCS